MSLGISSFSEAPISALASTNVILSLTGEELTITAVNIGIGAGVGASFSVGNSMAYMGRNPFKKKKK